MLLLEVEIRPEFGFLKSICNFCLYLMAKLQKFLNWRIFLKKDQLFWLFIFYFFIFKSRRLENEANLARFSCCYGNKWDKWNTISNWTQFQFSFIFISFSFRFHFTSFLATTSTTLFCNSKKKPFFPNNHTTCMQCMN